LSQEDLCDIFCQSKGTVAKTLRKLEDKGYIERIINKDNRRKYILTLTKEGEEVISVLKREMDYWHNSVGLAEVSEETMDVIRAVARKSYNLVNE
jgi:DNA-binding MarR family transcriptional regulator